MKYFIMIVMIVASMFLNGCKEKEVHHVTKEDAHQWLEMFDTSYPVDYSDEHVEYMRKKLEENYKDAIDAGNTIWTIEIEPSLWVGHGEVTLTQSNNGVVSNVTEKMRGIRQNFIGTDISASLWPKGGMGVKFKILREGKVVATAESPSPGMPAQVEVSAQK